MQPDLFFRESSRSLLKIEQALQSAGNDVEMAELLLQQFIPSMTLQNERALFQNPLRTAAFHERGEMVDLLLSHGANPTDAMNSIRSTKMARLLIGRGARVNKRDASGITPLNSAMRWIEFGADTSDLIRYLLLEGGADPTMANRDGTTPLQAADGISIEGIRNNVRRMLNEAIAQRSGAAAAASGI